ncbi:MAG: hypothetical protein M1812_004541 [Candelaria pacifica]|nr:MAG: hypothetical protein M1812_004541 [Candelaria pacifica]
MATIMWAVGINITSSVLLETPRLARGYGFTARGIGFLYFTPFVAVIIGEFFGHFFNDFLAHNYIKRHSGLFKPEVRLYMNYLASLFMIPGLVLLGFALGKHWHWGVIVVGWGLYAFGVILASVAITTYSLDKFPKKPAEVAGILNFARAAGGFSVGYFQQPWGKKSGYEVSFGVQAAIVAAAMGVLVVIQVVGGRGGKKIA